MAIPDPVTGAPIPAAWGSAVADMLNHRVVIATVTPTASFTGTLTLYSFGPLRFLAGTITASSAATDANVKLFDDVGAGVDNPDDTVTGAFVSAGPNGAGGFSVTSTGSVWARPVTTIVGTNISLSAMWLKP